MPQQSTEMAGSSPLTLTESHLSAEATSPGTRAAPRIERPRDSTLPPLVAPNTSRASSETLQDEEELTEKRREDLEKGETSEERPPRPRAADGSEVIVVDWKGELDPACPKNWPYYSRMGATLIVAAFTFLSPASSTMIAPAAFQIADRFNITNDVEVSMVTSIFVLAYAVGPLFLGPMSELYGRTIVLQSANMIYLIFNLACGFATSKEQMLAFRFLSGLGGSAPLAIGAGVLGDLWRPEERGRAAALYSIGPLLGPALGPIAGGWIAQCLPGDGYRWVFYSTTIFCALVQIAGLVWLRETYYPTLLSRQAQALKKELNLPPNSDKVQTVYEVKSGTKTVGHVIRHGLMRPFAMFWHERIIQILSVYMAFIYGLIYLVTVSTTDIFRNVYGFNTGLAGTHFAAQGLGFFLWSQIQARLLDVVYRKLKERYGGEGKPEYRLPMMIPASLMLPLGILLYGWGAQNRLHWIVVDIGMFFVAASLIGTFQCITTYLIDAFTLHAASALAAASSFRSLAGFGFPLFAPYMYTAIGYGWSCTILAVFGILIGWPAAPWLYRYGEGIRLRSRYHVAKT